MLDNILGPESYDARIRPSGENETGEYIDASRFFLLHPPRPSPFSRLPRPENRPKTKEKVKEKTIYTTDARDARVTTKGNMNPG